MTAKQIEDVVYNYKIKNEIGFTSQEIDKMLEKHFPNIAREKLNETIGIVTCALINNQVITYHTDIYYALRNLVLDQPMNSLEWD